MTAQAAPCSSFWLRGPFIGMNEIARWSKWDYDRERKNSRLVVLAAVRQTGVPRFTRPVIVSFEWHEEKKLRPQYRRDPDNIRAYAKLVLDGMVDAGVLLDDGPNHIAGLEDRFVYDAPTPGVRVTIREATAE